MLSSYVLNCSKCGYGAIAAVPILWQSQSIFNPFCVVWRCWQTWCHLSTDRMRAYSVLRDPHAPPHTRVNAALSQAPLSPILTYHEA